MIILIIGYGGSGKTYFQQVLMTHEIEGSDGANVEVYEAQNVDDLSDELHMAADYVVFTSQLQAERYLNDGTSRLSIKRAFESRQYGHLILNRANGSLTVPRAPLVAQDHIVNNL